MFKETQAVKRERGDLNMEITVELLRKIRKELTDDYNGQIESHSKLTDVHEIINSSIDLRYTEGQRELLAFLEYVLKDDSEAIGLLNAYLEED